MQTRLSTSRISCWQRRQVSPFPALLQCSPQLQLEALIHCKAVPTCAIARSTRVRPTMAAHSTAVCYHVRTRVTVSSRYYATLTAPACLPACRFTDRPAATRRGEQDAAEGLARAGTATLSLRRVARCMLHVAYTHTYTLTHTHSHTSSRIRTHSARTHERIVAGFPISFVLHSAHGTQHMQCNTWHTCVNTRNATHATQRNTRNATRSTAARCNTTRRTAAVTAGEETVGIRRPRGVVLEPNAQVRPGRPAAVMISSPGLRRCFRRSVLRWLICSAVGGRHGIAQCGLAVHWSSII